ncbi:unnamed protein product [Pleuronectes platessa]|uniref:Uncharacterized protein n=1 Tax=Pleuronectes platessa TaxID=8262 RepID=A0A9N7YKS6_PLEPL|nr:unnamed protein product [Pleuronectes platessa]
MKSNDTTKTLRVLERCLLSVSCLQPVMANAAGEVRKGKQALPHLGNPSLPLAIAALSNDAQIDTVAPPPFLSSPLPICVKDPTRSRVECPPPVHSPTRLKARREDQYEPAEPAASTETDEQAALLGGSGPHVTS